MLRLLSLFFLFAAPLLAENEVVVHVAARERLPSFLLTFSKEKPSGFDSAYLSQIEHVLQFDLQNTGRMEPFSGEKNPPSSSWKQLGIRYSLSAEVINKAFTVSVHLVDKGQMRKMDAIPLSGNLSEDRKKIHQVADALHEALFGTPGIAKSHILYTLRHRTGQAAHEWKTDVWQADYDGGNPRQITHEGTLCVTPTFVPALQGRPRQFLYVSYKMGQPKIFAASLENGQSSRFTYIKGNQLMPTFSPKKDQIAFVSDVAGNPDLFVQDFSLENGLTGKPRQIFSAPQGAQGSPTFSPDGKKVAFVSNKDGVPRIYILDIPLPGASVKGLKPVLISKQNRENTSPAWSPDGTKIAYSAMTKGVRQIWVYDLASREEMQITEGGGHKENPSWASNSLHLVFDATVGNTTDLYFVTLTQKREVKITSGRGEKRFPAWEPLNLSNQARKS